MKTLRYIIIIIIHKQLIVIPEIMNIPETETVYNNVFFYRIHVTET